MSKVWGNMSKILEVNNFSVTVEKNLVVERVNLVLGRGEVHAIMGRNGSGKSSLVLGLAGHPMYKVSGEVKFLGQDLLSMNPSERAKEGILLAFQSPVAIPGVSVFNFLKESYSAIHGNPKSVVEFKNKITTILNKLGMEEEFLKRYVNDGFSGGERKKMEVLQALLLEPKLLILDEIDSGLDVDSLKIVSDSIKQQISKRKMSVLIISHYKRLLEYLEPDKVHLMEKGSIVRVGDKDLVEKIENEGYANSGKKS